MIELKENDVYRFEYNEEQYKKHESWFLNHCFDGQLVVKKNRDGELYLMDTYWGFADCGENHRFTLEKALQKGNLEFICNLDDVISCSKYDYKYYDKKDIFDLSYQHHCYEQYMRKKDAKRLKDVMLDYIYYKIKENKDELEYKMRSVSLENAKLEEICKKIDQGEDLNKIIL